MNEPQKLENQMITGRDFQSLKAKTPPKFIKVKPGRGGKQLAYVDTGYVINRLNKAFSFLWDFKVLDQSIGNGQVWVKGELTVHISPTLQITKSQFGGSDIKMSKETGKAIDIADDLKAAASDCLKKCASMFGVASDVYFPTNYDEAG